MPYRYFTYLGFKGTQYHGWQIQPGAVTVQEVLNKALSLLLREQIYCVGAGRTDAGVHASCFFAHFDSQYDYLQHDDQTIYKLNCILPRDISVYDIVSVPETAHARFDAISRTYVYRISQTKDPFTFDVTMHYTKKLDVGIMNQAAEVLKEYTDFTSFSKLHTDVKTNNCKILNAQWNYNGAELQFTIEADRFLRNMVRAIVGTLIEVGLKKISFEDFRAIIESKNRSRAGTSVEACGLHLVQISYPCSILTPESLHS